MDARHLRRLIAAVLFAALAVAGRPVADALEDPGFTKTELFIPSEDGTKIHVRLYRPTGVEEKTPVILTVTPYAGSGGSFYFSDPSELVTNSGIPDPGSFARRMLANGYTVMTALLRGYGGSGGCYDFGGKGEQADAVAAVEWAASQPWSTGKVGMTGHSYDGETQLMALARRARGLAATVPSAAPSGYTNLYTNGVRNFGGGTAFGAFYAANDAYPPAVQAPPEEWTNALTGTASDPACYARVTAGSYSDDPRSAYWRERDLDDRASRNPVPTLYVHGFNDWNVRPSAYLPRFDDLAAEPRRAIVGPWDHGIPQAPGGLWQDMLAAWFDEHLKGIEQPAQPRVLVQEADGRWRGEADFPPPDARMHELPIRAGSYLDVAGNFGETGLPAQFPAQPPVPLPTGRGSWTFTPPLPHEVHISGLPRVRARLAPLVPGAGVIALLYDVAPDGSAAFVQRGAALARSSGTTAFDLYPIDHRFAPGHRIGLLLTGADDAWFESRDTLTPVTVRGGTLELPVLGAARDAFLASGPFLPRTPHAPFKLDGATIEEATVPSEPPPAAG